MTTTPEQIDRWREGPEDERLEFKEAKRQMGQRDVYRYCVALANEGGGHLLLGVADKLPRPIVGTGAVSDHVEMQQKILEAFRFRVSIEEVRHPDGRIVVLNIPPRPRGTAYPHEGAYWMRSGDAVVP